MTISTPNEYAIYDTRPPSNDDNAVELARIKSFLFGATLSGKEGMKDSRAVKG